MGYCGMEMRKESETCEGILSHFCLKPGSEITFVNEKNLRNQPVVSVKLKTLELKPVKFDISNSNVTAVQEQWNSLLRWSF